MAVINTYQMSVPGWLPVLSLEGRRVADLEAKLAEALREDLELAAATPHPLGPSDSFLRGLLPI